MFITFMEVFLLKPLNRDDCKKVKLSVGKVADLWNYVTVWKYAMGGGFGMMLSEVKLAVILVVATFAGGFAERMVSSWMTDANVERETAVQMTNLAIAILNEEIEGSPIAVTDPKAIMRNWAFDTLNNVAAVKLPEEVRTEIVSGTSLIVPFDFNFPQFLSENPGIAMQSWPLVIRDPDAFRAELERAQDALESEELQD